MIDDVLGAPWRWLLKVLCNLTGQDNIFFARMAFMLCIVQVPLAGYVLNKEHGFLWAITLLSWLLAPGMSVNYLRRMKDFSGDGVLPLWYRGVLFRRTWYNGALLAFLFHALSSLPRSYWHYIWLLLPFIAGLYFLTETTGKKKSLPKRALEKVASMSWSPSPATNS
jgi:hypothetical protein